MTVTHFLGKGWSVDAGEAMSTGPNRKCGRKGIVCGSA